MMTDSKAATHHDNANDASRWPQSESEVKSAGMLLELRSGPDAPVRSQVSSQRAAAVANVVAAHASAGVHSQTTMQQQQQQAQATTLNAATKAIAAAAEAATTSETQSAATLLPGGGAASRRAGSRAPPPRQQLQPAGMLHQQYPSGGLAAASVTVSAPQQTPSAATAGARQQPASGRGSGRSVSASDEPMRYCSGNKHHVPLTAFKSDKAKTCIKCNQRRLRNLRAKKEAKVARDEAGDSVSAHVQIKRSRSPVPTMRQLTPSLQPPASGPTPLLLPSAGRAPDAVRNNNSTSAAATTTTITATTTVAATPPTGSGSGAPVVMTQPQQPPSVLVTPAASASMARMFPPTGESPSRSPLAMHLEPSTMSYAADMARERVMHGHGASVSPGSPIRVPAPLLIPTPRTSASVEQTPRGLTPSAVPMATSTPRHTSLRSASALLAGAPSPVGVMMLDDEASPSTLIQRVDISSAAPSPAAGAAQTPPAGLATVERKFTKAMQLFREQSQSVRGGSAEEQLKQLSNNLDTIFQAFDTAAAAPAAKRARLDTT